MKKVMALSFSFLFALSVMAFAQVDKKEMEKMKKEKQEMTQLVEKYNKATSDKKKEEIKAKIQAKVAANYDKHLERMEKRLEDSQKKLAEAKAKLAEGKKPEYKAKHIAEITEGILSGKHKPMFGVPPADMKKMKDGHHKGMKGDKDHHKGCPCMKEGNKDGKTCPFMKDGAKDHKDCPCKDKMKGGKAEEILPVKPEVKEK
ncbi:MAG: hypothetical protein IJJ58_00305 [Campylobacter sp.]|nr:hypothetical protein [Campylobacter sp.]